jgi:hypothetical protein
MREMTAAFGLTERATYWGWLDFHVELPLTLPPIHALLNTSAYEGVPLTMLDALALGIPCLFPRGVIGDREYAVRLEEWDDATAAATAIAHLAATAQCHS